MRPRVVALGTIRKVLRRNSIRQLRHSGNGAADRQWLFWKTRKAFFGALCARKQKSTPVESLNLRAGEWIEIKPLASIAKP